MAWQAAALQDASEILHVIPEPKVTPCVIKPLEMTMGYSVEKLF